MVPPLICFDSFDLTITLNMDKNGTYIANGIPVGCARVVFGKNTLPPGANQTAGTNLMIVKVLANGTITDFNGFNFISSRIKGMVFSDVNGKKLQNPDEPGFVFMEVVITHSNDETHTLTAGENGAYLQDMHAGMTISD